MFRKPANNLARRAALALAVSLALAACSSGGLSASRDQVYAPSVDPRGQAVDGLVVGHRLMAAGQPELALDAFTRAAAGQGLTGDILVGLGSANLALGRLNQSEKLLRRAIEMEPDWAEAWNNLGVVLMERQKVGEAAEMFKRAFALDNGESASIRENLKLALQKLEQMEYGVEEQQNYRLVRRGSSEFLIRSTGI